MATLTGNNGVVKIDNASGTPTTIAAVRNFSIGMTADTIEKTVMGNDTRQYLKGMSSFSGSADIYFDPINLTGGANVIAALIPTGGAVGDSPLTVELFLDTTNNKFSGEVIVTGYTVNSSMDGMVEASISFQGSGPATFIA
jgi:predicted secreted protein